MKTEEQKSAFILRVEEMVKELETLMPEGGGERSCIILVNEKPKDSDTTAQCVAIMGDGKGLVKNMAAFLSNSDMLPVAELGAKLAAIEKIVNK